MVKPYIPPPRGPIDFPAMYWDPKTKEPKVYKTKAEVPDGHLDSHPDNPNAKPHKSEPVEPAVVLSRIEIMQELQNGGVAFRSSEGTPALYERLVVSLKKALDEAKIKYPKNADAKALLELLPLPV